MVQLTQIDLRALRLIIESAPGDGPVGGVTRLWLERVERQLLIGQQAAADLARLRASRGRMPGMERRRA